MAGFLTKRERAERIVDAVRRAARGEVCITGGQRARALFWQQEVGERWARLTRREREVLRLPAQGLDNAAISSTLGVQLRTVEQHITNILDKLALSSRLEAASWMRDHMPKDLWKSTA